jgi:hypothetical protein
LGSSYDFSAKKGFDLPLEIPEIGAMSETDVMGVNLPLPSSSEREPSLEERQDELKEFREDDNTMWALERGFIADRRGIMCARTAEGMDTGRTSARTQSRPREESNISAECARRITCETIVRIEDRCEATTCATGWVEKEYSL